jgi:hypothetical protein
MKKIFLLTFIISCLFLGSTSTVFGEMMSSNVGVANGDVFRYSYTSYFHSNDPHTVPPADLSEINQTDYFMINVTGVSGASVNFETMLRGLNGSSNLGVCSMNVGTGMASISGYGGPSSASSFYFMARNVGMMGRMFPSSSLSPTINDTFSMPYTGGSRLTNHYVTSENNTLIDVYNNMDIYYDQATGMMVQWRQETLQTSGSLQTNSTQVMNMTSSNVWTIPEFPLSSALTAFIIGGAVSVAVLGIAKFKRASAQKMKPTL